MNTRSTPIREEASVDREGLSDLADRFDWMMQSEARGVDMRPELLALKADVFAALQPTSLNINGDVEAAVTAEREAVRDYLLACSAEANRQYLKMASDGHRMHARDCKAESKAYANAAAMVEREDHASYRIAIRSTDPLPVSDGGEG